MSTSKEIDARIAAREVIAQKIIDNSFGKGKHDIPEGDLAMLAYFIRDELCEADTAGFIRGINSMMENR